MDSRDLLTKKRSVLRSKTTKTKSKEKILLTSATFIISIIILFSVYSGSENIQSTDNSSVLESVNHTSMTDFSKEKQTSKEESPKPVSQETVEVQQKEESQINVQSGDSATQISKEEKSKVITPPKIIVRTPLNITIKEGRLSLEIFVEGDKIDTVWTSIDNAHNIIVSNSNGTIKHVYNNLSEGQHNIVIHANNTFGNQTTKKDYFTVKSEVKKEQSQEVADTGNDDLPTNSLKTKEFEINVTRFSKSVLVGYKGKIDYFAKIELSIKNIATKETKYNFNPKPVLFDDLNNQYDYIKLGRYNEIKETDTLYPSIIREGVIYFTPLVSYKAQNITLVIHINSDTFEVPLEVL